VKKAGTLGLDIVAGPGVDYVLDLQVARLPFPDESVEYVHASHFLEHIKDPTHVFGEISRVCRDGALLEFWTPYAWENSAFVLGHQTFFNEDHYLHICLWYVDFWQAVLKKRWLLLEIGYVIEPPVLADLFRRRIDLEFALRYCRGIVKEFGVFIEVRARLDGPEVQPRRWFATSRAGERHPLLPVPLAPPPVPPEELARALAWFRGQPGAAVPGIEPARRWRDLVRRARAVAREEGVGAAVGRTARYLGRRLRGQ
jgi:SAM-dependent methyltransferase